MGAGVLFMVAIGAVSDSAANAATQASMNVEPNAEIIVDTSETPLIDKTENAKGKITTDQTGKPPAAYRLVYRAPADANGDLTEIVRYEKNGVIQEVAVRVIKPGGPGEPGNQSPALGAAFKILIEMFVLALLLEQALSVIFNWRPFLQNFDARGVKTIVSVLAAWFLLDAFKLDLVKDLVNVYAADKASSGFSTKLLTALILAGGSSGVNNILVLLGFRSIRSAEQIAPKPPRSESWIAVRLIRTKALGQVTVSIGHDAQIPAVVGLIAGSSWENALARYFLVDRGRFPVVGGHSLTPDPARQYIVQLEGVDKNGTRVTEKWGPYPIAAGAVIDIVVRL